MHLVAAFSLFGTDLRCCTATTMCVRDTCAFLLDGFHVLSHLHVEVNTHDLASALFSCASWSVADRASPDSVFELLLMHVSGQAHQIEDALHVSPFMSVLGASEQNGGHVLKGTFRLSVQTPCVPLDIKPAVEAVCCFLDSLRFSAFVQSSIEDAMWLS